MAYSIVRFFHADVVNAIDRATHCRADKIQKYRSASVRRSVFSLTNEYVSLLDVCVFDCTINFRGAMQMVRPITAHLRCIGFH